MIEAISRQSNPRFRFNKGPAELILRGVFFNDLHRTN